MRLTRLREDGGDRVLELHLRLTVVVGLGSSAHAAAAAALVERARDSGGTGAVVDAAAVASAAAELLDPRVGRLRAALADSAAAVGAATRALDILAAELRRATVARGQLAAELALRRRQLDPFAPAALGAANELFERLSHELGAIPGTGLVDPVAALRARLADAEERCDAVRAALDGAGSPALGPLLAAAEAAVPAGEIEGLRSRLAALEEREGGPGALAAASDRVDAARADLAAALRDRPGVAGAVRVVEEAHERLRAAERRLVTAPDQPLALVEMEEAAAAEQHVLADHGFASWSAYVMRAGDADGPEVRMARAALADAERCWEDLLSRLGSDPEFADILDRLADAEARARLGADPADDVFDRLREELAGCGVPADPADGPHRLVERARTVFDRGAIGEEERARLERAEVALMAELAEARAALAEAEADPTIEPVALHDPRLAKATVARRTAAVRVRRHREALERVSELVAGLDELGGLEEGLLDQQEAQDALLDAVRRVHELTLDNLDRARGDVDPGRAAFTPLEPGRSEQAVGLAVRRTAERLTRRSAAGPSVLVVAGVLDGRPADEVRRHLDDLAEQPRTGVPDEPGGLQIVVLTEDDTASAWADAADPSVAAREGGARP